MNNSSVKDNSPTTTDIVRKSPGRRKEVRIDTTGAEAVIQTQDGEIDMRVPLSMVQKRMRPGEKVAYFVAWLRDYGTLEIADRLQGKTW